MEIDPPPDIVIEIDVANNSPDKFSVYSALGVPEVWRYKASLQIWILNAQRYLQSSTSAAISILNVHFISDLMESRLTMKRTEWARDTRKRIRALIQ